MNDDELRDLFDRYAAGEMPPDEREAFLRALERTWGKVKEVEERVGRLDGKITDRVERAVGKVEERLAEGEDKLRRRLNLLDELELARRLEEKLRRVMLLRAPERLRESVMEAVAVEGRPRVVLPPLKRSPLPAVLFGVGLAAALAVGTFVLLPLFGVDPALNLGAVELPEWLTWLFAGLSVGFGGAMLLRTLVRAKTDPAFRTAAKR
ncbi:MAG TPA: hypothetical protein ENN88_00800 [Candidatus Coatesbacteria bacterium]|nr:hypothetical protein [Candidatus Coatesbacteria bacterium]